ncbi:hypothetical protein FP2506_00035 [Fulvimarina pelagi HTCC2506]|uniref:Uncharacterized protein n=1 Tax=Fulvimarina pelagi HTCC2506 TaxID=314231 RepID=Q0FXX8_9HYPH|nr:hypothetical protein FP2506_00035 [Fulvimarina pelagi HTCC2506]
MDTKGQKLIIKHEELTNLDMPAMTMLFSSPTWRCSRMLPKAKHRVRRRALRGKLTVTKMK